MGRVSVGSTEQGDRAISPRLTVPEVAAELRQCTRYVYGLINRKAIGHVREGRKLFITRAQLEAYQRSLEVHPEASITEIGPRLARAEIRVESSQAEKRARLRRIARDEGYL